MQSAVCTQDWICNFIFIHKMCSVNPTSFVTRYIYSYFICLFVSAVVCRFFGWRWIYVKKMASFCRWQPFKVNFRISISIFKDFYLWKQVLNNNYYYILKYCCPIGSLPFFRLFVNLNKYIYICNMYYIILQIHSFGCMSSYWVNCNLFNNTMKLSFVFSNFPFLYISILGYIWRCCFINPLYSFFEISPGAKKSTLKFIHICNYVQEISCLCLLSVVVVVCLFLIVFSFFFCYEHVCFKFFLA